MIENVLYIILALLGISFLVFIHELGHYWMARRVGITVEVFSIGFGKAIYEWERRGVKWKICWLLFGGYVKMAGTEKKGAVEPYQIPDGFFGKSPWARIKVSVMGPLVNLVFAFIAFAILWTIGGRLKPFNEYTHYVGWVEGDSNLFKEGVRPGDKIQKFNGHPFHGFQELLVGIAIEDRIPTISGEEVDYFQGTKQPFQYAFSTESSYPGLERASIISQMIGPASYLLYDRAYPFPDGSPLKDSGIEYGDRLFWVDGQLLFSQRQLVQTLNEPRVLLTVEREGKTFLTRVPRLKVADMRLSNEEINELDDWRFEAHLSPKVHELFFIPYNLSPHAVVQSATSYVDEHSKVQQSFQSAPRSPLEIPLEKGDQIMAVDGMPVQSGYALLNALQKRRVQIIVQKRPSEGPPLWREADLEFAASFDIQNLQKIIRAIGTDAPVLSAGNLRLLHPVTPVSAKDFPQSPERERYEKKIALQRKELETIKNPQERDEALKALEEQQKRLMLGVILSDQKVRYNPPPYILFGEVANEVRQTLTALVTGYLSPKNLAGPIGIVRVMQTSWTHGVKEALYWLGMISLNLGLLNLLPIPVLDGGYILLAIVESITKKPLKAKTMERLIIPFVILIVIFFIYITFHDITRIFR